MKKILLATLAVAVMAGCSNQELESANETSLTPLEDIVIDLSGNGVANRSQAGTKENPIIIPVGTFLNYETYTVPVCDPSAGVSEVTSVYRNGQFTRRYYDDTISPYIITDIYRHDESGDCLYLTSETTDGSVSNQLEFGKYYSIYGEVITQTSPPNYSGNNPYFFYREVPNSDKIQKVTFRNDRTGVASIGSPIDYPHREFNCEVLEANNGNLNGKKYVVQSNGGVYEKIVINIYTTVLRFAGRCNSNTSSTPTDICEGINEWQSGTSYSQGDQVTYNGYLYTRLSRGWRREGACS